MSTDEQRRSVDVLYLVLAACIEHGASQAILGVAAQDPSVTPLIPALRVLGLVAGGVLCVATRPRVAALVSLGVVTFGGLMVMDGRLDLGRSLVNAGQHAFVPGALAFFAEREEETGPSPGRYLRLLAFLMMARAFDGAGQVIATWPAPCEDCVVQDLRSVLAVCILLLVAAGIALSAMRGPLVGAQLPPPSIYRGPLPAAEAARPPPTVARSVRALAPLVVPAAAFGFMIGLQEPGWEAAKTTALVHLGMSLIGGVGLGLAATRLPAQAPLTMIGSLLPVAAVLVVAAQLMAPASAYGPVITMNVVAPATMAYAVFAAPRRRAPWAIAGWYALHEVAAFAGGLAPSGAIYPAAIVAFLSGVWLTRNVRGVQARFDETT